MSDSYVPTAGGRKARPLRGSLWGLMSGIGLALVLISTATIGLELIPTVGVVVASVVVGALWSWVGPTKAV